MHVRTLLLALLATAVSLSGCSGGGDGKPPEPDPGDLGLVVTEETGVIRGVVVDERIVPLAGVKVVLSGVAKETVSNDVGGFGFDGLEPGTYFLSASKPGFKGAQQSAEVEAGVAEPALVKVLMVADPASRPTYEVFHFQGYLECSALTGPFFWPCEGVGNDKYYAEYPISGNASHIHVSMVWEPTQAFGRNLYFNLFDGYDEYQVAEYNGGPSPLFGDANASAIAETDINAQGYLAFEVASDGEHLDGTPPVASAGASVKQGFDAYIVVFHGFSPPEGYNYVDDGEPKVPE